MDPVTIRQHLRREPFVPFRVYLDDGTCYDVRHPRHAMVTRTTVVIGVDFGDDGIPETSALCTPAQITRIEPLEIC